MCLLVQERDAARSDRQQAATEAAIATRQLQTLQQEQLALQEAHAALQQSNALLQQGRLSQMEAARIASGTQGVRGDTAAGRQAGRGVLGSGAGGSPGGAPAASSLSDGSSRSPGTADAAPAAGSGTLRPSGVAPSGSRSPATAEAAPAASSGALQPSSLSRPGLPSVSAAAPHQGAAASAAAKTRPAGQSDSRPVSSAAKAASMSPFDELRSALFDQRHDLRPGSTAVDASQHSSLRAGPGPSTAERMSPQREEMPGAVSFAASRVVDGGLAVHGHLAAEPLELAEELEDAFQDPDADRLQQEASFGTVQQQGGTGNHLSHNHGSMTLSQIASPDYLDGI